MTTALKASPGRIQRCSRLGRPVAATRFVITPRKDRRSGSSPFCLSTENYSNLSGSVERRRPRPPETDREQDHQRRNGHSEFAYEIGGQRALGAGKRREEALDKQVVARVQNGTRPDTVRFQTQPGQN